MVQIWEVVGGNADGGIQVRKSKELNSELERQRLSTGALIRENAFDLDKKRLQYKLIKGTGPRTGWVTTRTKNGILVEESELTYSEAMQKGNAQASKDQARQDETASAPSSAPDQNEDTPIQVDSDDSAPMLEEAPVVKSAACLVSGPVNGDDTKQLASPEASLEAKLEAAARVQESSMEPASSRSAEEQVPAVRAEPQSPSTEDVDRFAAREQVPVQQMDSAGIDHGAPVQQMDSASIDHEAVAEAASGSDCQAQDPDGVHVEVRHPSVEERYAAAGKRRSRRHPDQRETWDDEGENEADVIEEVERMARERLARRLADAEAAAESRGDQFSDPPWLQARERQKFKDTAAMVYRSRWGDSAEEYEPEVLDFGDLFRGEVQAAWVVNDVLHVVKDGKLASTVLGEPWDGRLQDGGKLFHGNVQAAWYDNHKTYVVRDGKVAEVPTTREGKMRWDGSLNGSFGGRRLFRGNVVAAWVADPSLYVVKRRGDRVEVCICSWGDAWDDVSEYWPHVLDSSCKTAWVHDGFFYVVKADI
mmetsp:Transcript_118717/g.288175  ORF Transcript_118717/g.288175 Transcript_118717/m.288175 type:complete len:534 (+) Transcript_118717:82-1683(+)